MKRLIAHRGIIDGNYSGKENRVETIINAMNLGYEVEVDVHLYENELWLGHDAPQEPLRLLLNESDLSNFYIWFHCKDSGSLDFFQRAYSASAQYFWHDKDEFTITSIGNVWTANLAGCYPERTIVVAKNKSDALSQLETNCFGICSPYVGELHVA